MFDIQTSLIRGATILLGVLGEALGEALVCPAHTNSNPGRDERMERGQAGGMRRGEECPVSALANLRIHSQSAEMSLTC